MTTLLRIDASARAADSMTRELADATAARLNADTTIQRDLSSGMPQVDADWVTANFTPDEERTEAQRAVLALSDTLIEELQAADTVLITVPVYNFNIPSALKAWVDMIARARVTFRYTENGPEGLLTGKRAILVVASGGTEVGGPVDFATPYMRHMLGFVGITDVQMVRSDRQILDPDGSRAQAEADIAGLAA
ncbi:FMN-dependent NADH-azoreductase [Allosediminivita pacifica]|nr:NAD(P)H-dependent oxidoreductase [Allosediminivita pacifica]GGB07502.1 FMN-dependent NADH-azoreductase [Allosediminivita pacifica]